MIAPASWSEARCMGLTATDWQEISDFMRFLQIVGPAQNRLRDVRVHDRAYAWFWYINGICGAPPLMREGDDN